MTKRTHVVLALLCWLFVCGAAAARRTGGGRECLATIEYMLDGFIAWPGSEMYNNSIAIDNGRITLHPVGVVFPFSSQDVALAIMAAQKCNLTFAAKNGGHSAAGYCLNEGGVVLDVSLLNATVIDEEKGLLHQATGGVWTHIYDRVYATQSGWVPVGGGCPTVGVTGFTLGGGFSFLSRSYGLGIDNLLSVNLVLANGTIVTVGVDSTSQEEQDLFWALRGGGGGNFGVVVSMTFQMHRPSPNVLWGDMCWPVDLSTPVLSFYNNFSQTVPDQLALYGWFGHSHGEQQFCITTVYNGGYNRGLSLLQPLLAFNPTQWKPNYTPFIEFEKINGNTTLVSGRKALIKSGMILPGGLTPEAIKVFQNAIKTAPSRNSSILWDHGGGAIAKVAHDATAYAHRSAAYTYEVKAVWEDDAEEAANAAWIAQLGQDIAPFLSGAYVNYIDSSLPNWQKAYYGDHYDRLVAIKQAWDPNNFFNFLQSIGSNYQPS